MTSAEQRFIIITEIVCNAFPTTSHLQNHTLARTASFQEFRQIDIDDFVSSLLQYWLDIITAFRRDHGLPEGDRIAYEVFRILFRHFDQFQFLLHPLLTIFGKRFRVPKAQFVAEITEASVQMIELIVNQLTMNDLEVAEFSDLVVYLQRKKGVVDFLQGLFMALPYQNEACQIFKTPYLFLTSVTISSKQDVLRYESAISATFEEILRIAEDFEPVLSEPSFVELALWLPFWMPKMGEVHL